jgi:hypothetical protein
MKLQSTYGLISHICGAGLQAKQVADVLSCLQKESYVFSVSFAYIYILLIIYKTRNSYIYERILLSRKTRKFLKNSIRLFF